jgi:hypothetical protein
VFTPLTGWHCKLRPISVKAGGWDSLASSSTDCSPENEENRTTLQDRSAVPHHRRLRKPRPWVCTECGPTLHTNVPAGWVVVGRQVEPVCCVPSVFGRNLQCQPVRRVDTQEECHWSHACSLQASRRGIQMHSRVQNPDEKRAPYLSVGKLVAITPTWTNPAFIEGNESTNLHTPGCVDSSSAFRAVCDVISVVAEFMVTQCNVLVVFEHGAPLVL